MRVIAIDPGSYQSGFVDFEVKPFQLLAAGDLANHEIREYLEETDKHDCILAVEEPTVMGQRFIQKEVMEAAVEAGRFIEAFKKDAAVIRLFRRLVLQTLFGNMPKNADAHVKEYARLECGEVGSPKKPGPLIKLRGTKHAWQALGCGLAALKQPQDIPF